MQYLEKTFELIREDNSLVTFTSKKTKSLFALLYSIYLVSKGEKVLYISSYAVIDDLLLIKQKFKISQGWIKTIQDKKLEDQIIITSNFDAIKRLKNSNSNLKYTKIIFDNMHYQCNSYLNEITAAFNDPEITINIIDFKIKSRTISPDLLNLFSKRFSIHYREYLFLWFINKKFFDIELEDLDHKEIYTHTTKCQLK
jgi:hypothetical protein